MWLSGGGGRGGGAARPPRPCPPAGGAAAAAPAPRGGAERARAVRRIELRVRQAFHNGAEFRRGAGNRGDAGAARVGGRGGIDRERTGGITEIIHARILVAGPARMDDRSARLLGRLRGLGAGGG